MKENRLQSTEYRRKRGLGVIEYVMLVAVLAGALITAQYFIKRVLFWRWREAADSFGMGKQYETQGNKATTVVRH